MTLEELEDRVRELSQSVSIANIKLIELNERLVQLKHSGCCPCRKQPPKIIELEIEWPEADINGLHFNFQRTKGVFELKDDGWYHSRDILFMSARNIDNSNDSDALLLYLKNGAVSEAFYQALKKAGIFDEGAEDMNVEISLPKEKEGVKKYNGIDYCYWLLPSCYGTTAYFHNVTCNGFAFASFADSKDGCAPAFRVGV